MELPLTRQQQFEGVGSRLVFHFVHDFQREFRKRVVQYGAYRLSDCPKYEFEPVLIYGEQQTKTCVTSALDVVCSSNLMQEYPVDRKISLSKRKDVIANGKLDYWCCYGTGRSINVLLEVKQGWIRYFNTYRHTVYSWAIKRHSDAVKQLRSIQDKPDFGDYGMALTILPIFHRTKISDDAGVLLDRNSLSCIANAALEKASAHAAWAFTTPLKQSRSIFRWKDDSGAYFHENYPAVVLIWSILKLRRGR